MSKRVHPVFLYDGYMSMDSLARVDVRPDSYEVAALDAWRLVCDPFLRIEPREVANTYGLLVGLTYREIDRLIGGGLWQGRDFHPEPVIVRIGRNWLSPALAYIPNAGPSGQPLHAPTLSETLALARNHGFPDWYLTELEAHLG